MNQENIQKSSGSREQPVYYKLHDLPQLLLAWNQYGKFEFELANIITPSNFYIAPLDKKLEYLEQKRQLNELYADLVTEPKENYHLLRENNLCVVKIKDVFYRAVIKKVPSMNKIPNILLNWSLDVSVYCIDIGLLLNVSYRNIYPLCAQFTRLPPRCFNCQFDLIMPGSPDRKWSSRAIKTFAKMLNINKYEFYRGSLVDIDKKYKRLRVNLDQKYSILIDTAFYTIKITLQDNQPQIQLLRDSLSSLIKVMLQTTDCVYNNYERVYSYNYVEEDESREEMNKAARMRENQNRLHELTRNIHLIKSIMNESTEEASCDSRSLSPSSFKTKTLSLREYVLREMHQKNSSYERHRAAC